MGGIFNQLRSRYFRDWRIFPSNTAHSCTKCFSLLLQNLYRWAGVNALPTGYSLPTDTPNFQHAKHVQQIGSDVSWGLHHGNDQQSQITDSQLGPLLSKYQFPQQHAITSLDSREIEYIINLGPYDKGRSNYDV